MEWLCFDCAIWYSVDLISQIFIWREWSVTYEHVTFWLLLEIVTGVRRAEGSPSPLSAHGGAAGANV